MFFRYKQKLMKFFISIKKNISFLIFHILKNLFKNFINIFHFLIFLYLIIFRHSCKTTGRYFFLLTRQYLKTKYFSNKLKRKKELPAEDLHDKLC